MNHAGLRADREGTWEKKNPGLGIAAEHMKTEEKSMIQTTRALSVEVEKTGDMGETAGPLKISCDPADIFLKFLRLLFFATHKVTTSIR
jgi:hypothetical protein